ncbi:unnamed protein product [Chondrus crispus]|uniref:Uncharacterized protein n=1 Tax=Chondrus crispus TaxID=2769 RepID=R7Q8B1_CHOCR|nr:unnamed protein product [Chondrus crispus]CDF34782.1 unnamed protein product [Chondrus crispus]|eukprot:XP_005714601.1 unnamed protein product [Chondrus crispus]
MPAAPRSRLVNVVVAPRALPSFDLPSFDLPSFQPT